MAKRDDRRRQERLASRRAEAEAPWVRDEALKRMLLNAAWLAMLDLKTRPARKKFESRFYLSDAESHGARPVVGPSVVAWRETSALVGVRDDEGRLVLARIVRSTASGSLAVLASTGRHEADLEFVDVDDLKDHVATSCEGGFVGIPFFLCDMVRDASSDRTLFKPRWAGRVDPGWDRGGWEKAIKVVRRNSRRGDERRLGRLAARGDVAARRKLLPAWVDELRLKMLGEALKAFESDFEPFGPEDGDAGFVIVAWREGEATSLSSQRSWRRALGGPSSPIVDGFVLLPLDVEWGSPGLAVTFGAGALAAAAFCRSPWLGEAFSESVVLFVPDGPHEEDDPAGLAAFLREKAGAESFVIDRRLIPGPRRNPRKDDRRRLERRAARGDEEAKKRLGRGRPAQSPALVGDLRWLFGMDAEKAELARGLIDGDVDPLEFESVAAWERQCHHAPPRVDMVMKAVCELVGGYGVEAIRCQGWHGSYHHEIHASYVNADEGPTLILDHEGTFFVTTLEDYLEEQSRDRPECFPGPSGNPRGERRRLERRAARGDEEARKRLEADEKARKPLSPEDVDLELLRVSREVGAFLSELAPDVGRVAWDAASGGSGSCLSESRLSEGVCRFFHVNVSVESSGRRRLATITVSRDVGRGQAPRYETDASASTSLTDAELRAWLEARGRPDRVTGTRWIATAGNLWFDLAVARKDGGDA